MRLVCPECGTAADSKLYAKEAAKGRLRCFECSTPGHPVYVEEETPKPSRKQKVSA